jgi:iron complex outermembrane recepter protein
MPTSLKQKENASQSAIESSKGITMTSKLMQGPLGLALLALAAGPTAVVTAVAQEGRPVEEVIVTGTRVQHTDFTSPSPITVHSGDVVRASGQTNVGEFLRMDPATGTGGFAQTSTLSGGGATSIDLRYMGAARVLVLINSRRVANFADALANETADLTFLPMSMVERVEILRDGASTAYGTDAITGVVNVILRRDFEGVDLTVNTGVSGDGDGEQYGAALTLGATGAQGNVVVGGEFRRQRPIQQTDRDWAFPAIASLTATSFQHGSLFSPGGVFFSMGFSPLFCTESRALGGDEVTNVHPNCEAFRPMQDRNQPVRYDYAFEQFLMNEFDVYSISGYGNYEMTPGINAFSELQFSKRQSLSRLDANPGSLGTPAYPEGSIVPATNPNNPTGQDGIFLFRPTSTIGTRDQHIESNTLRFVAGIEGELPAGWLRDGWGYELSGLYTRVDASMLTRSTWNLARFIRISDPEQCAVDTLCRSAVNPSGALDSLRPGNWTPQEIDYLRQDATSRSEFETTNLSAIVTGPIVDLPAGALAVAFGADTTRYTGFNKPDSMTEGGESVANANFETRGSFRVGSIFAEIDIPILRDAPFAESLTVNLQGRHVDYSNFGTEQVWTAGANWQPIPDFRIRGKIGTAFRAPTVTDLFGGGTASFDFFTTPGDPCDPEAGLREPGNVVDQNCLAQGVPMTYRQPAAQMVVLAGSNPDLQPETADTYTVGLVITPTMIQNLAISLDLWNIEVENIITRPNSNDIMVACYTTPGLAAPECANFGRDPNLGTPVNFVNRLANLERVEARGYDVGINYVFDGPAETRWRMDLQGTYVEKHRNPWPADAGEANDRGSIPRIRSNLSLGTDWQNWSFTWVTRYTHRMDDPRFNGNNPFNYDRVRRHFEHDVRAGLTWNNFDVMLGVNNVFDRDPPYVFSSGNNTDAFLYRPFGRYFFLRAGMHL